MGVGLAGRGEVATGDADAPPVTVPVAAPEPTDLRMPVLAVAAWLSALAVAQGPAHPLATTWAGVGVAVVALPVASRAGRARQVDRARTRLVWSLPLVVAVLAVGASVAGVALVQRASVASGPVTGLADEHAAVVLTGVVAGDPHVYTGRFADQAVVRVEVRELVARGERHLLHTPVLLVGGTEWAGVQLGATVHAAGLLAPADDPGVAAVLDAAGPPRVVAPPGPVWRAAASMRAAIRGAVEHRPPDQRALVPGLVDGDDGALAPDLVADFRTAGLTHLTAVSGTNLTLVVGFLLVVARWCGVRGRWLRVLAAVGILGFVVLARPEPSVLRAAVMGGVGLLAMTSHGRGRALRGLSVAVVVLLLLDPALAVSPGFALSALATAGIVLVAPRWRDALARWLPLPLAEAIAVPAAAQLACTPVVAVLSGRVSLVAVGANLLAEPAVGPATVLGLVGGLAHLVWAPLGRPFGLLAGWCAGWLVRVARHAARTPSASVGWGSGVVAVLVLTALVAALVLFGPWLLRRPVVGAVGVALLLAVALVRIPRPGWPGDWAMAMCDVGQGDGLVLNAGPHVGVVVDAGPDPAVMDDCLRRLHVDSVALLVLTHFHADHVDGLSGVLDGRAVGEVWTTTLLDPPGGVQEVADDTRAAGLTPRLPPFGATETFGDVTVQPVWPPAGPPVDGPGDGSTANEASIVMVAQVHGLRMLLTGDVEPPGQEALAQALPGFAVDVLKVPHHGSRYQDLDWLASVHASVALISVGADNDYGHPAPVTVDALDADGDRVYRTDQDGTVLVSGTPGHVEVRTSG